MVQPFYNHGLINYGMIMRRTLALKCVAWFVCTNYLFFVDLCTPNELLARIIVAMVTATFYLKVYIYTGT